MINYNHLHYFHVVAAEGSIAAAAARLHVTQPTVSEQVRALERVLQVKLFDRTATGLKLTDAGTVAYEHTLVMFRAGERMLESLKASPEQLPKTLRVGLGSGVARAISSDFLMPLLALDACVPTIRTADHVSLLRGLRERELDLVLVENEPAEVARNGLECVKVDSVALVAVAPVDLVLDPTWRDTRLLHYRETSGYRWDIEAYLEEHGLKPTIAAECDDALFLVEAAVRGGYVAFVPRSVARDAVAAKRLRIVADIASHAGVYALYPDGDVADLARRAVQVLVDTARA